MGLSSPRGLLILGVTAGGAAANAGIRFHDVLLKVNGSELRDLSKLQAGPRAGGTVPVEVFRDGAIKIVQVRVGP
ncbi:MAG: PDZ domain-containing protein [Proteobacteria bacterium]|nr:PDZ domain-containing protein [Pseudomonadota bacterium]